MVSFKLENFGGMIPAVNDYYLPENASSSCENAWVYSGAIEGFRELRLAYTCQSSATRKVFRLPLGFLDATRIPSSYWMEFENPDTDVVRTPIASDIHDRYYWASEGIDPQYSPRSRITASLKTATVAITIASPGVVTLADHGLTVGDPVYFTTTGALPTGIVAGQYYFVSSVPSSSTFQFALTPGGTPVDTSGSQSGVQTLHLNKPLLLGVPAPTTAPGASSSGGSGTLESRTYIYTWETAYGEEGPPSNPSTTVSGYPNGTWSITVTNPLNSEAAQRKLKYVNIYRAVTASTGVATYFFVARIDIGTTSYSDTTVNVSANNQLQSVYWSGPPADLKGMISMPNGMIAGFHSNEIWFCEPYRPHAWPAPYVLSVEYPIVGLGVIGQTLVVCTAVSPYAVSGVNPATMTISRISVTEPCTSRGSIVSTPAGVVYSAPEGLVLITPGGSTNLTRGLFTKEKWQRLLTTQNLRGAAFNNGYYAWGSQQGATFQQDSFQTDSFQQADLTGGFSGGFIDFTDRRVAFTGLNTDTPAYNTFNDVWTNEVFIIKDGKVFWLDTSEGRPPGPYRWRSKIFSMPNRRNLEAMRVWFDTFDSSPTLNPVRNTNLVQTLQADQWGLVRVYADDTLIMCRELRIDGELMRLPSGFKAATYQIEIEARVRVVSLEIASAAKELVNV